MTFIRLTLTSEYRVDVRCQQIAHQLTATGYERRRRRDASGARSRAESVLSTVIVPILLCRLRCRPVDALGRLYDVSTAAYLAENY